MIKPIKKGGGFPGGSVVRNLHANTGDMGSIPGPGRPTCRRATKLVRHQVSALCSRAQEPQLLSPCAITTEALQPTAHAPQQKTITMKSPRATTKSSPCSPRQKAHETMKTQQTQTQNLKKKGGGEKWQDMWLME